MHRASDGAVDPGFRPIPSGWDAVVEFSRDGGALFTRLRSATGVAVRRWSAKTGEPMPGAGGDLLSREASFLGFTRFGEFCVTLPAGLDGDNYTAITLRRVGEGLTPVLTLRFADHATAGLAASLLLGAKEIRAAGPDAVVATLDSGAEVSVAATPAWPSVTNERTKRRLVPPVDSDVDFSKLVVSPDGTLLAAPFQSNQKSVARVWDAATGLPLSERLWHEGAVSYLSFSPDGSDLMTLTNHGLLRRWFCGGFAGGVPQWATRMGEALGGVTVAGGVDVRRLAPEEYARARRGFEDELRAAAAAGDEAARFLLSALGL